MGGVGRGHGPQARRQRRGQWTWFAIAAGMAACLFGVAIWEAAARPGGVSAENAAWAAAAVAALGALMAAFAWHAWAKLHPSPPRHVRLAVAPTEVRRGERVEATLTFMGPREPGSEIELVFVCTERYDIEERSGDDHRRVTREADVYQDVTPVDADDVRATFDVPLAAPFSYEGDCISAVWRLRVRERRARRPDRFLDQPLWVLP